MRRAESLMGVKKFLVLSLLGIAVVPRANLYRLFSPNQRKLAVLKGKFNTAPEALTLGFVDVFLDYFVV